MVEEIRLDGFRKLSSSPSVGVTFRRTWLNLSSLDNTGRFAISLIVRRYFALSMALTLIILVNPVIGDAVLSKSRS